MEMKVNRRTLFSLTALLGLALFAPGVHAESDEAKRLTLLLAEHPLGATLEKRVIGDMEDSYAKGAAFTNKWLKEKGLATG